MPASHAGVFAGIGDTPLVELDFLEDIPDGVRLFAKLESTNPGGSIKDRPVARMLSAALRDGRLDEDRRLLDSSSGNAGIAYAMLGAALDIPVTLVVPGNASRERLQRIRAHGAELILTDPSKATTTRCVKRSGWPPNSPSATGTATSTPTRKTGGRTMTAPAPNCWRR